MIGSEAGANQQVCNQSLETWSLTPRLSLSTQGYTKSVNSETLIRACRRTERSVPGASSRWSGTM